MADPDTEYLQNVLAKVPPVGAPWREGAVLTGWVVITEWMDTDGEKWLSFNRAEATAPWAAKGMCWEALHNLDAPDLDDLDDA